MKATEKMDAFGMKALEIATGKNLVTLYRWRRAIEGEGISDANKRLLIQATAGGEHAISLGDFYEPDLTREPGSPAAQPEAAE